MRARARQHRKSISLEEHKPTASELARRKRLLEQARRIRGRSVPGAGPFSTSEELQREDRRR